MEDEPDTCCFLVNPNILLVAIFSQAKILSKI